MRHTNKLALFVLIAAFATTAAASAAVGYGIGVTNGSNMHLTYPSFFSLVSRPVTPAPQVKKEVGRYEREGKEYVEAAELYLNNALEDINRISAEAEAAAAEADDFIAEYNRVMQESY